MFGNFWKVICLNEITVDYWWKIIFTLLCDVVDSASGDDGYSSAADGGTSDHSQRHADPASSIRRRRETGVRS